tara:strand:+ start:5430 stop:5600 length:171 start_codon:yes stop_codon:yes gene_type:complete
MSGAVWVRWVARVSIAVVGCNWGAIDILLSVGLTRFCAVKACGQVVRYYSCLFGKL